MESKTFKREFAAAFALILCWSIYNDNTEMVEVIVWPFVSYIAAVSGLHIYRGMQSTGSSQLSNRRGPERSRHTDREGE